MTEDTFEESYLGTIQELIDYADNVSSVLNTVVVKMLGEDADWSGFAGVDGIPTSFLDKAEGKDNKEFITTLWALREQANSICNWNSDHDLHEWAKNLCEGVKPDPDSEMRVIYLEAQLRQSKANHEKDLKRVKTESESKFNGFKADVLIALKAMELITVAAIRDGRIELSHWRRDERAKHLQTVIANSFLDFSDRTLPSYDDDF